MNNNCNSTTSGMSYSYNIPKEYRATSNINISCYKDLKNYGACQAGQIVPPSPTTVLPAIFNNIMPHSMPKNKQFITSTPHINYNRNYHNVNGQGIYGSEGANKNTQDTYRKISMPNQSLACGGLGDIYSPNQFKPGFNDVSQYHYYH
jgi:hypothetical protein